MSRDKSTQPTHAAYVVEGDGENAFWTKIGAAWPNADGEGFNVVLTAFPVSGRLVLRKPRPAGGKEGTDERRGQ